MSSSLNNIQENKKNQQQSNSIYFVSDQHCYGGTLKRIKNEYQQKVSGQNQKQYELKLKRVKQPIALFAVHTLIAAIISFQNIFLIYGSGEYYILGIRFIIGDLFFITFFSCLNSYFLVPFKSIILTYVLLDRILISQLAALIGLIGSLILTNTGSIEEYLLMIMTPISFIFFVGNFRLCIRYADWNRVQIVIYKISIIAGAICFFQIGAYFMAVNYSYTQGQFQDLDLKIKDFITLYAFGTFQFFGALLEKICDFDQTSELQYVYQFKETDQSD